jgi:hypothetical protein
MIKKISFTVLFFTISHIALAQIQIGSNINGSAAYDYLGTRVSISSDGSIIAIGAPSFDGIGTDCGQARSYKTYLVHGHKLVVLLAVKKQLKISVLVLTFLQMETL